MNEALQEALHTIPKHYLNSDSKALQTFKETFNAGRIDNEKWLTMPRKFTRCATRFTLPINTQKLSTMTPFQYLSDFVWISEHRKQLYRFVFNKYVAECDDGAANDKDSIDNNCETPVENTAQKSFSYCEYSECMMPMKKINIALIDVLGYCGTIDQLTEKIAELLILIQLTEMEQSQINYRSWCGLVAFAERFLNPTDFDIDPCDEVEIADFETLDQKSRYVIIAGPLKVIFDVIKHNKK